ncbi:MAG: hypothetical protein FWC71_05175 [Defluviitaleaceae bacterium]|nr:hypothetical protein [Defluviitaleaceae bacterium]
MIFRNRPPSPLFARRGVRLPPEVPATEVEMESPMRLFPLDFTSGAQSGTHRAVNPLVHRSNALGQSYPAMQPPNVLAHQQEHASMQARPHALAPQQGHAPTHAPAPMQAAAPPAVPMGREQAAEQFNRVNKSLPDGVHYEPLDEQTLKLLRDNGHLPPLPGPGDAPAPPRPAEALMRNDNADSHLMPDPAPMPQTRHAEPRHVAPQRQDPPHEDEPAKKIKQLIQDSHNAFNFYSQLAHTLDADGTHEDAVIVFQSMADDCAEHVRIYGDIARVRYGVHFIPADVHIKTNLPFDQALKLATREENKMIQTLANVLQEANDITIERELQYIFNKKNVGFHRLMLLDS